MGKMTVRSIPASSARRMVTSGSAKLVQGAVIASPFPAWQWASITRTAFSDFAAGPEDGSVGNTPTSLPALARRLATRHPLRLEATAEAATAAVEWDRLRVALEHLLDYACRSGPPGRVS